MNKNKVLKSIIIILIFSLILLTIYNMYTMYQNIEIYSNYEASRTSLSTNLNQNVENIGENKKIKILIQVKLYGQILI